MKNGKASSQRASILTLVSTATLVTVVQFMCKGYRMDEKTTSVALTSSSSSLSTSFDQNQVLTMVKDKLEMEEIKYYYEHLDGGGSSKAEERPQVDSNTGILFTGQKDPLRSRTFQNSRLFGPGWQQQYQQSNDPHQMSSCKIWGVVTTIFTPSLAILRAAAMEDWCVVIVADTKTPSEKFTENEVLKDKQNVRFLSIDDQKQWISATGGTLKNVTTTTTNTTAAGRFIKMIPYRHFARKNIGYLYAIQRGASYIFDFDDDNYIKQFEDKNGQRSFAEILPVDLIVRDVNVALVARTAFNPYPLMNPSNDRTWPRGFPLEQLQDIETQGSVHFKKNISMDAHRQQTNIAVIQFCADGNPDIDAIYRLTETIPVTFQSSSESNGGAYHLLVPQHTFTPYNAQASLHTRAAFWALLLPFTVPGRVSDIWRSYFSQCIFRELGFQIVFGPPQVVQDRNEHNYLADMQAELDLYFKTGQLIEFLDGWRAEGDDIPSVMENLWIELYERRYIDRNDILLVQHWLSALVESGYSFPKLKEKGRRRHHSVAIMGQFDNEIIATEAVVLWYQKWRQSFQHVIVRGVFGNKQMDELSRHSISASSHQHEVSLFQKNAPKQVPIQRHSTSMGNLALTLKEFQNHSEVESVMYVHDGSMLNLNGLLAFNNGNKGNYHIKNDIIIGTELGTTERYDDLTYDNLRTVPYNTLASRFNYKILRNGEIESLSGMKEDLYNLTNSTWMKTVDLSCIAGQQKVAMSSSADPYREDNDDGSMIFLGKVLVDVLIIPTSMADPFSDITKLFAVNDVNAECSAATIVDIMRRQHNVSFQRMSCCTYLAEENMTDANLTRHKKLCLNSSHSGGHVYPVKLGQNEKNWKNWDRLFDVFTYDQE